MEKEILNIMPKVILRGNLSVKKEEQKEEKRMKTDSLFRIE